MTEDMHEERLQAVEAFGDSFVSASYKIPAIASYIFSPTNLIDDIFVYNTSMTDITEKSELQMY